VFTSDPDPLGNGPDRGRIYADVWIATDLPDVDVFVRMTDVYPNNGLDADGARIQRARYRNGTCPSCFLNRPTKVRVDLHRPRSSSSRHKLRVIVTRRRPEPRWRRSALQRQPQNEDEYTARIECNGSIKVLAGRSPIGLVIPVPTGQTPPPDLRPNTTPCPQ